LSRMVTIYIPPRNTMQSGIHSSTFWRISLRQDDSPRWSNPLMGWTSTRDPLFNVASQIRFETKEDAIKYCEKHGFDYEVDDTPGYHTKLEPKNYGNNFKHVVDRKEDEELL